MFPGRHWHDLYADPKPIVFGHHVVGNDPFVRDDIVFGIDTGACHGLSLTALTVPDFKLFSVPARADHWSRSKREWQVAVLASKPWPTMTWSTIEEKITEFERTDAADVRAYVASLREWASALSDQQEHLLASVESLGRQLRDAHGDDGFADAARRHPVSSLLFAWRANRLSLETIRGRTSTPARLVELCAMLGVTPSVVALPNSHLTLGDQGHRPG
ncbi:MAG TPA: hypothetical protein VM925_18665 [Labilithrix sp.]|nr:hypothetical protein [Labilithrix sp.]